ncbi:TPA: hypothetical protein NIA45_004642 [Pseudomonas aeruginosa]|nr:hypothetical protein [Pseudomonas aeruginosa]
MTYASIAPANRHTKQYRAQLHRLHQVAGRLAKQAGFNAEPYLTFPLRAPGVQEAAEAEIAAGSAPASTPATGKVKPVERTIYGDPNSDVTNLEISAEAEPERTLTLIDKFLEVAPDHLTHCMSAWNRARRLKHYLTTGEEIDQGLSWDQDTGAWVI